MDPATASDASTLSITENIFDSLLDYDYAARPPQLRSNTLMSMPEVSADKLTYTFRLRPGIRFTADAGFGSKSRELTAEDYVYSIKRLYDPALKSPWLFLFEHKLLGDEALLPASISNRNSLQATRFNIDIPIPGIQATDRYTITIRLKQPDNNLLFALATPATGAVSRKIVEAYREPGAHPVGTGPYRLETWQRNDRIVLAANDDYFARDRPHIDKVPTGIVAPIPAIRRVDIKIMEEQQARVLGFLDQEFDILEPIPAPLLDMALDQGHLKLDLQQKGIMLSTAAPLRLFYLWMNMDDPVIGGYTPEKVALRRAIALAYDQDEDIRVLDHGMALPAQSPLPPEVLGYDPAYRSSLKFDPALANALLDRYGYRRPAGGVYRSQPNGKPLVLTMHSLASTTGRLRDEFWRRSLEAIGVKVLFKSDRFGEIIKASRLGTVQMAETNWIADFPDGENFYQLLYGGNVGRANYARFKLPEYDRLFLQSQTLQDSTERTALYHRMNRLIEAYSPWILRTYPLEATLVQPWIRHYKRHPLKNTTWRYLDIDDEKP